MTEAVEVTAGDTCPIDGGTFVPDLAQDPETLIDRHTRNANSRFEAAQFAERMRAKVADTGVIHKCTTCGYRARFQAAPVADDADTGGTAARRRAS